MKKNKPEPAGFFGLREVAPYHPRAPCTEIPCMLRFGYVMLCIHSSLGVPALDCFPENP